MMFLLFTCGKQPFLRSCSSAPVLAEQRNPRGNYAKHTCCVSHLHACNANTDRQVRKDEMGKGLCVTGTAPSKVRVGFAYSGPTWCTCLLAARVDVIACYLKSSLSSVVTYIRETDR